jgi:hypothetical protein
MPRLGFEPTIPVLQRVKKICSSDVMATVIVRFIQMYEFVIKKTGDYREVK